MELPVLIERLPDQRGFAARLVAPLNLSVEAATAEEAHQQLATLLQARLQEGIEFRSLAVTCGSVQRVKVGWLPDDELTQEWRELIQQFRAECDTADRARLDKASDAPETAS
jgi:hypothetical protein